MTVPLDTRKSHEKGFEKQKPSNKVAVAMEKLTPRNWVVAFSPRKKFKSPRTPLDSVDSLDGFQVHNGVVTPRPGRKVCDHCESEAASTRLHCVRGTSRVDDESNDFMISLCDKCIKKEEKGELESELRTARHARAVNLPASSKVRKLQKMKSKMKKFWTQMISIFYSEDSDIDSMEDLSELNRSLSASFNNWVLRQSLRSSSKRREGNPKKKREGEEAGMKTVRFSNPIENVVTFPGAESPQQSQDQMSWWQTRWMEWTKRSNGSDSESGSPSYDRTKRVYSAKTFTNNSSANSDSGGSTFSMWPGCFG